VDVCLLLPGRSDVPLVRHAGHGYFRALLRLGVRVFEYGDAILHAKTLVADDFVSVVGSTNLDFRSFHFNAEANLVILDAATGRTFARAFRDDLTRSKEIEQDAWSRRGRLHRIGDNLARRLGPLL
jgi:cardiolipin synthase